jgi:hypothetical protein
MSNKSRFPNIRVLKIKKTKVVEAPSNAKPESGNVKANAVRGAKKATRPGKQNNKKNRRKSARRKRKGSIDDDSDDEYSMLEPRFRGLIDQSLVQIRRTRDSIAARSSPTSMLRAPAPPVTTALEVLNWFDTKSDGLTSTDPKSIMKMLEFGLDKQKKRHDRLVILGEKKRKTLQGHEEELEKIKIVSEKGAAKQNKLNARVEQLIVDVAREKSVANAAEEYTYIQRLLTNRAKKPADDLRVGIAALQREIEATEKELACNRRLAHRRKSSSNKSVSKASEIERQYNAILQIYDAKRDEYHRAKNGADQLQIRLKSRAQARNRLMLFLNGDHGEDEEKELLDEVMKGEIKMKELEERQKDLMESGKAIEDAFFNMQQMSNTNTLDECVYNFIHREDKYKNMLKQEKRMIVLINTLKEQNAVLRGEDAKAQFVLSNRDLKRDMMTSKENFENDLAALDTEVEKSADRAKDSYLKIQSISTCLLGVYRSIRAIIPDRGKRGTRNLIPPAPAAKIVQELPLTDEQGDEDGLGASFGGESSIKLIPVPPSQEKDQGKLKRRARSQYYKRPSSAKSSPKDKSGALQRRRSEIDASALAAASDKNSGEGVDGQGAISQSSNKIPSSPTKGKKKLRRGPKAPKSPISTTDFNIKDYEKFIKDVTKKLTNVLAVELEETKNGTIRNAELLHQEFVATACAVQSRPGNIRVAARDETAAADQVPEADDDKHFSDPAYFSDEEYEIASRHELKEETYHVVRQHGGGHHSSNRNRTHSRTSSDGKSPSRGSRRRHSNKLHPSGKASSHLRAELENIDSGRHKNATPSSKKKKKKKKAGTGTGKKKIRARGRSRSTFLTDIETVQNDRKQESGRKTRRNIAKKPARRSVA